MSSTCILLKTSLLSSLLWFCTFTSLSLNTGRLLKTVIDLYESILVISNRSKKDKNFIFSFIYFLNFIQEFWAITWNLVENWTSKNSISEVVKQRVLFCSEKLMRTLIESVLTLLFIMLRAEIRPIRVECNHSHMSFNLSKNRTWEGRTLIEKAWTRNMWA